MVRFRIYCEGGISRICWFVIGEYEVKRSIMGDF